MNLLHRLHVFLQRSALTRLLFSFRREFLFALGFTALINILMLTPTVYMLQIFDRVLASYSEFTLVAVTLMLFFFLGVMSFSEWVRARLLIRLGVKLDMRLNPLVFAAAFAQQRRGQASATLFSDLTRIRQFLTGNGLFACLDAPWTPIYILALFLLHPWLGILSIIFCLVLCGVACLSSLVMQDPLEEAAQAGQQEAHYLDSKLRHTATVAAMGMLGDMRVAWLRRHAEALTQGRRGLEAQARMQALTRFVRFSQQSLSLGAGALLVIYGEISPGAMIAANALMGRATHPVDALMNAWRDIRAVRRAFLNLETALEIPLPQTVAIPTRQGAELHLSHAWAHSSRRPTPILQDISLDISAGMALGVMGPSGSGKSTLARVLLGIWPETEGAILFDGVPICELERQSLGENLGYLPQDVELFAGTIAENVARFGGKGDNASRHDSEKIIAACRMAGVHDMILRFAQGYDTRIGDGGRFLSGGQRQRIGLARALYGNPRLVVLDEPNANLDDAGEQALLQAVRTLKQRGTSLVLISHRPQIMAAMEHVLVLREGRMVHFGAPPQAALPG
ncbi:MAG: type I secretion system permease/ATPase [Zoogloeaceae bacterium]|nr:type I secretion system permease/ATPase [Zoogloeaceae bacterium]